MMRENFTNRIPPESEFAKETDAGRATRRRRRGINKNNNSSADASLGNANGPFEISSELPAAAEEDVFGEQSLQEESKEEQEEGKKEDESGKEFNADQLENQQEEKKEIQVGDYVSLVDRGVLKWEKPKKVKKIEVGESGRKYAYCGDVPVAIPLELLVPVQLEESDVKKDSENQESVEVVKDKKTVEKIIENPEVVKIVEEAAEVAGVNKKNIDKVGLKERIKAAILSLPSHIKNHWKEMVAGGGAGFLARTAIRLSFGSSLGLGIAAGAVGGALAGGVREYVSQKKKVSAESILEILNSSRALSKPINQLDISDLREVTALLVRLRKYLNEGNISGSSEKIEEVREHIEELDSALKKIVASKLEYGLSKEKTNEEKSEAERLYNLLKIIEEEKSVSKEVRKEVLDLINHIKFERGKVDRKKIAQAMLRGAAFGAVGGAIGGAISHFLFPKSLPSFGGGGEIGSGSNETLTNVLKSEPQAPADISKIKQYQELIKIGGVVAKESLEQEQQKISEKLFHVSVEKGDGITHLARRAIHDYLVNLKKLNPDDFREPSVEQLIYAEDTLVKKTVQELAEKGNLAPLEVGEEFTFTGKELEEAISKALSLSPEKVENLKHLLSTPEHTLSEKTRSFMTSWGESASKGNGFFEESIENARRETQKAVEEVIVEKLPLSEGYSSLSQGTNAVLENAYLGEGFSSPNLGVTEEVNQYIFGGPQEETVSLFNDNGGARLFNLEDFSSSENLQQVWQEKVGNDVFKRIKGLEELLDYYQNHQELEHLKDFISQNSQETISFLSSDRFSLPGKSLLEKEQFIQQFKDAFERNHSQFLSDVIKALEKNPNYVRSLNHFRGVIQSCGLSEKEFSSLSNENVLDFIKKYGEKRLIPEPRNWDAPQFASELTKRRKLAAVMKKIIGDEGISESTIDLSKFKISDFLKYFL